jgi:phage FluMu gp28-like protein
VPLIAELRQCPYDQQKQLLFHVGDFLRSKRRLQRGVLDANGNGMVLAQETRQHFGAERIVELMPSDAWLREMTPKFSAAFTDRTLHIPADLDTRDDLHQFRIIRGVGKIPSDVRTEGTDGGRRHADNAVALLNFYAATQGEVVEYAYESGLEPQDRNHEPPDEDGDIFESGLRFGEGCW